MTDKFLKIFFLQYSISLLIGLNNTLSFKLYCHYLYHYTGPQKKSGMNFTCEYTNPMDFEPLNPNPVSEFPLDPPVFPKPRGNA